MQRWLVMIGVMVLVVAACGGDSDEGADGGADQPETTQATTTPRAATKGVRGRRPPP